ncbi:hypothetical protein CC78DRAFT_528309 [Lojkania enalia]|uniref:Key lime pathogenicity protein n=1 Tax=Lojkania enalia TaxID=147567 RepID=A0A9P4NC78_9PLEO|nr:hypothetical protein CC78DRAFT_528309 [Didymosphaeria enalia]
MAAVSATTDTTFLQLLQQARQDFWSRNPGLSEQQRQELWQQYLNLNNNSSDGYANSGLAQAPRHVPRMLSYAHPSMSHAPDPNCMGRVRSAPASVALARSISTQAAIQNSDAGFLNQRSVSAYSAWQTPSEEMLQNYTLSPSGSVAEQNPPNTLDDSAFVGNDINDITEYTLDEWVNTHVKPSSSSPFPLPNNQNPNRLLTPLTQSSQWSQSLDGSVSPSTPSTTVLPTPTLSSSDMSRDSSFNTQLYDSLSMLRVGSDFPNVFPYIPEDVTVSLSSSSSKTISACADTSNFLSLTGSPSEVFLSPAHVPSSASALTPSSERQLNSAEDMQRSHSLSSESSTSNSAVSLGSRQWRREREINALASRKIAPKAVERKDETPSPPSRDSMVRIQSQDGSSKNVGVITKAPYVRPQHPKIKCPHCDKQKSGFRGTHELERHIARAHATVRKAFICIDASKDKKFLANCKHCRNRKQYGAYYNAAAHLRRAHFHPRKRGRKGKNDEKRGGSGGGDHPAMDYLRQYWIQEIEVKNEPLTQKISESAAGVDEDDDDSFDLNDFNESSLPSMPPNDTTSILDFNQFFEAGTTVFDSMEQYGSYNDPNNFEFDDQYMV